MTSIDALQRLADELTTALARDFGTPIFPNPDGYQCNDAKLRTFRQTVPVVEFRRGNETLSFIVTPTNPAEPAYRRSLRYDIVYFSEDCVFVDCDGFQQGRLNGTTVYSPPRFFIQL